ncbi:MAG: DUF1684 domain-containing protein [Saprospiraceae bacterium]|nr:DUF1684 domain-containing protein [Saprospiraceae bacterium]
MRLHLLTVFSVLSLLFLITPSCQNEELAKVDEAYLAEVEEWRIDRIENLTSPTGWLTLSGLFWLKEGDNFFGGGEDNQLVFPGEVPAQMGRIVQARDSVWLEASNEISITHGGEPVTKIGLSGKSSPVILAYNSLSWFLLQRGGKYGIRLRDSLHEARAHFAAIEHYPVHPEGRVPARLVKSGKSDTLVVKNVLDMEIPYPTEGKLVFEWEGEERSISVLDGGEKEYFLIFRDETTGAETYPAGRYLYTPKVDENGMTYIDFNKAYNPPCAFTEFATCLLPPPENHIAAAIRFGEKDYGAH